jgi:hypothetical protein
MRCDPVAVLAAVAGSTLHRLLQWATLVSKDGKKGSNLWAVRRTNDMAMMNQKVSPHDDSWTVAMEAGIRSGVRNSSPAEWGCPENGRS